MMRYLLTPFMVLAMLTAPAVASEMIDRKVFKNDRYPSMIVQTLLEDAPECEGGKRKVLMISSAFTKNARSQVAGMIKSLPQCPKRKVYLDGGFGYTKGVVELGQLFKRYDVHTVVPAGLDCNSICWLAFIGGRERSMENSTLIEFELPCYSKTATGVTKRCNPRTARFLSNHIREMLGHNSISKGVIDGAFSGETLAGSEEYWTLDESEAREIGLVTD